MPKELIAFFEWIVKCCELLGKDKTYGVVLTRDSNWKFAWHDKMTPEEAVKEFLKTYPNGYPAETETKYANN